MQREKTTLPLVLYMAEKKSIRFFLPSPACSGAPELVAGRGDHMSLFSAAKLLAICKRLIWDGDFPYKRRRGNFATMIFPKKDKDGDSRAPSSLSFFSHRTRTPQPIERAHFVIAP